MTSRLDAQHHLGDEAGVALLTELVALYSPSGQEGPVAQALVRAMSALGFEARVDEVGNAVGTIGRGERQLLLMGHIDTAPGQIPFSSDADVVRGRGSVDAKGSMATFVMAAARAYASGTLDDLRTTVVGAVEEECATSTGARHIVEHHARANWVVIGEPSGCSRITLGYKGRLLVDYRLVQRMAHTAGQRRGACEEALEFWRSLERWAASYNLDKSTRFETFDPSLRSMASDNDGIDERVELHIGLRLPLGWDRPATEALLQQWRGTAELHTWAYEEPFRADKSNPLTSAFLSAIRAEGGKPSFVNKTGTSDMNILGPAWGAPIVAYGPGDSSLDHTPEEHLPIPEYLHATRVLERVIRRLGATVRSN